MRTPSANCRQLLAHMVWRALARAWANTGKRMAARTAIIAMTTRSSMRVKALNAESLRSPKQLLFGFGFCIVVIGTSDNTVRYLPSLFGFVPRVTVRLFCLCLPRRIVFGPIYRHILGVT